MSQAQFAEVQLSASSNGRPIKVAATATPGTLIHTVTAVSGEMDEMNLAAQNTSASDVVLTIELGGVTNPDDRIIQTIPAQSGLVPVVQGIPLSGGVAVRAYAGTTNVLTIVGAVNRIA